MDGDAPPGYVPIMDRRQWLRTFAVFSAPTVGIALVTAGLAIPTVLLFRTDEATLDRWSKIGEALSPIGVFFSGVAFVGIALTLFLQGRELRNQREELTIAREEQQRSSEIALRELHTSLIRMAIDDPELRQVWPLMASGAGVTKKDHYCNLILNLQKVAYETRTIELAELRGALGHLMESRDIYLFWRKVRAVRVQVTQGDEGEDFFTAEVDRAFAHAAPPVPRGLLSRFRDALRR
ncbi:hypothetical protein Aros01_05218 [Streptosporangium roseum]|uniref:Uncharacterized protein n=1 Tax=Streptosporangium roseum (strain ATCC 12428 / DSM 43021 / JCM 3005 / KCTC 9067 / NCIMB 10171 / NRRL 2505 / NI 9100) TaxID=479432 RepID=D2AYH8_STRRD|nr:hypothetical protein Sros_6233 [Streptosporangium roseum DSM 43021]